MRSDMIKRGKERAPHRALLKAVGLSDEDMDKPFIAVCNSYTDIVPGHVHLDQVGEYVKQCIRRAGGVPFVFNTIGICDGIAMGHVGMKFSLPSRELIADCVESMLQAHRFDGMICIPNCDKIIPGMMMAAMRVNIPTIFVSGGPMEAGKMPDGRAVDLITVAAGVGQVQVGQITEQQLEELVNYACPSCGSCSGMFTANSRNCLAEAIGLALPGNGTLLATSDQRRKLFARAAQRIVEMVRQYHDKGQGHGLLPREICTRHAIDNAMILDMAMGGSSNTVLHLLAIADEAEVEYDIGCINDLSGRTPYICKVSPACDYHIEDVHRAGGVHTILGQIQRGRPDLLNTNAPTVTGQTLGKNIADWDIRSQAVSRQALEMAAVGPSGKLRAPAMSQQKKHQTIGDVDDLGFDPADCIRTCDNAYSQQGGLAILYGNLAPDSAIIKTAGVHPDLMTHSGPAVIFENQEDACQGILGGQVKAGDVVVIRYEGPKGGPGMQEMLWPTSYIKGMGLIDKCALITDGRFSGGTIGTSIGHICPEAAAGGPLALLHDGDIIQIDIPAHRLDVKLSDAELEKRRRRFSPPPPRVTRGYLARYTAMAASAATGAVLKHD